MNFTGKTTNFLLRTFIKNYSLTSDQNVRASYVKLECWVSILGNVSLGLTKLIISALTGSISLAADAAHTFGDMISSIVLIISMRIAVIPADHRHPFGHGRAEILGTLALSTMLVVTAVEFVHASFHRIMNPSIKTDLILSWNYWYIIPPLLILFWLFKEWMAQFSFELGKRIKSDALAADAQHHRSDALATLMVLISFIVIKFNAAWIDGICGIIVACLIGWSGIHMLWLTLNRLMGEAPDADMVSRIISAAAGVRGVTGVHGIEVHDYGNNKVISLHIEVSGNITTEDSHKIATLVEENIKRRMKASAVVHVEAKEISGERACHSKEVEDILRKTIGQEPRLTNFHAVHITNSNRQIEVDFHITMKPGSTIEECHRIEHTLTDELIKKFGIIKVNVHCEPEK